MISEIDLSISQSVEVQAVIDKIYDSRRNETSNRREIIFVCPDNTKWWKIHSLPAHKFDSIYVQSKLEAIQKASEIARQHSLELKIQRDVQRITTTNSYWKDSFPSRV